MRRLALAYGILAAILGAQPAAASAPFFSPFSHIDRRAWFVSDGWSNGDYQSCAWRSAALETKAGRLSLRVAEADAPPRALSCGELHSRDRFGHGVYEVRLRAAAGSGLNTAFFTYVGPPTGSARWDEIDFEFLGKDTRSVQINYHANGVGGHEVRVPLWFDASAHFHDYAIDWEPEAVRWYVDGRLVHQTSPGTDLPQSSGNLFLSLWSGSASLNGWLGPLRYIRPVAAEVDWAAFTPRGQICAFPDSITCGQ